MNAHASSIAKDLLSGSLSQSAAWEISSAVWEIEHLINQKNAPALHEIRTAVRCLNTHRYFGLARELCNTWVSIYGRDIVIERVLAQALIDSGDFTEAEHVLKNALAYATSLPSLDLLARNEIAELGGLFGRLDKQRFIATSDPNYLQASITSYFNEFQQQPSVLWLGINVVALCARAEWEGLQLQVDINYRDLAKNIFALSRERYSETPSGSAWFAAIASEASLALGEIEAAELWLYRFMLHPTISSFSISSYERQLREIWLVQSNKTATQRLLDRIRRFMMKYGVLTLWPDQVANMKKQTDDGLASLEVNFGMERTFSAEVIRKILRNCGAIGKVTDKQGLKSGTGFLVKAEDIGLSTLSPGTLLFITNAHVVSPDLRDAIRPEEALIQFEIESDASKPAIMHAVETCLFSSPPSALGVVNESDKNLDVSILLLKTLPEDATPLQIQSELPTLSKKSYAFVVGHPRGGGLQISILDSLLLDICDAERLIHYRTPTEPGSSGSPTFNTQWNVIALHHGGSTNMPRLRGSGTYEANEGLSIKSIFRAVSSYN